MKKYIKSVILGCICILFLTGSSICSEKVTAQSLDVKNQYSTNVVVQSQNTISPLVIVKSPSSYLNKTVLMRAKFDKFSTLGLDYSVAYRSADDYISFLVKREDTQYDIPLSEMKLFLTRKEAEKFINLKTDDEVEIEGRVFSDALGDAWIDVTRLTLIKKAPEDNGVK